MISRKISIKTFTVHNIFRAPHLMKFFSQLNENFQNSYQWGWIQGQFSRTLYFASAYLLYTTGQKILWSHIYISIFVRKHCCKQCTNFFQSTYIRKFLEFLSSLLPCYASRDSRIRNNCPCLILSSSKILKDIFWENNFFMFCLMIFWTLLMIY